MRAAITLHPDMAPVLGFEPSLTVLEAAALLSVTDTFVKETKNRLWAVVCKK